MLTKGKKVIMKYDFTSILDRNGKDAIAVEHIPIPGAQVKEGFDRIPMWVADMNFPTAPTVVEAMMERVQHPAYGYFDPSEEYYASIIRWQEKRNGVTGLEPEHIGYENGVLGGVISALNVMCSKGDNVLLHSPTYIGFTMSLENNGYHIVHSPLVKDENGVWRMDFEDMEKKIVKNRIHAAVFCSPHNPCGRVWERWEIEKAMELYKKYDVFVISDEIWSDLTLEGHKHIPTQSVNEYAHEHTFAFYAPSKTFNLAGLVGSYHIVYNSYLRDRLMEAEKCSHYNSANVLSISALMGAYTKEGAEWVDELREVLTQNVDYAYTYITTHFEGVSVAKAQGTYMLYLDCSGWLKEHPEMTMDDLIRAGIAVGVVWQDGRPFMNPNTIRMNLAVPHALVKEAMDRLDKYVFNAK
mgnify:FL=1